MASSTRALSSSLDRVAARLRRMLGQDGGGDGEADETTFLDAA
jgi:hypothetical protein